MADTPQSGAGPPQAETVNRSLIARWTHEDLFDKGFVATPVRFLELYAHLQPFPLSPGEAMFVLELMSFKWTSASPFPSYKRIAERMNVTDKMVRRYAQSLETKGYLKRQVRKNTTNMFDLSGLFNALRAAVQRSKQESERLSMGLDIESFARTVRVIERLPRKRSA
jgi:DNA-binding MarR family transcriptional regulator